MEHQLEQLVKCPSCKEHSLNHHSSAIDYTYSRDSFSLVECSKCQLVFTNPRPTENSIGKYYENPDYVSHTDTKEGLLFKLYSLVKTSALKGKLALFESFNLNKQVLDYGAGSGDFSAVLANAGWNVTAYEPDIAARERIRKKSSKINIAENLKTLNSTSQDIICLWHVLEHVHQLPETLQEFNRLLTHNGKLVIAVPNHLSYDAKHYGSDWAAYDVPRHLYHFDYDSMQSLANSHGFILEKIKPMWFDSFYVSLLSEKNRRGNGMVQSLLGWISAFIVGGLSNISAISSTKKCSSITYIFKKSP